MRTNHGSRIPGYAGSDRSRDPSFAAAYLADVPVRERGVPDPDCRECCGTGVYAWPRGVTPCPCVRWVADGATLMVGGWFPVTVRHFTP